MNILPFPAFAERGKRYIIVLVLIHVVIRFNNIPVDILVLIHVVIRFNNIPVDTGRYTNFVAKIDKDTEENFRTRSQQINIILTEYYKVRIFPHSQKR